MIRDWERLEAWLRLNEAKTLADLNPPATTIEIQDLERRLGCALPSDYIECLKIHAGQQGKAKWLFDGNEFLSPKNVLLSWAAWNDLLADGDLEGFTAKSDMEIQAVWWSRGWIPFASNGGGDFLCLDMAPTSGGHPGQVIEIFHDFPTRKLIAPDFKNWFSKFIGSKLA